MGTPGGRPHPRTPVLDGRSASTRSHPSRLQPPIPPVRSPSCFPRAFLFNLKQQLGPLRCTWGEGEQTVGLEGKGLGERRFLMCPPSFPKQGLLRKQTHFPSPSFKRKGRKGQARQAGKAFWSLQSNSIQRSSPHISYLCTSPNPFLFSRNSGTG